MPVKKNPAKFQVPKPVHSVLQGWVNLASEILRLAIEDARQEKDPINADKAKYWLLSPAGRYLFEFFLSDADVDIKDWVLAGCPRLGKK
jgi:hypothetical protein